MQKQKKGFTILEILLVIALIGILLGIMLVVLNPRARFASARNDTRQSDIKRLETALTQYRLQEGSYPAGLSSTLQEICDPDIVNPATNCGSYINLSALVPTYIQSIPQDPNDKDTTDGNGYQVAVNITRNIVAVKAIQAESSATISINDPLPAGLPGVATNTPLLDVDVPIDPPIPTFMQVEYLIIGGGGGGGLLGGNRGGGGGAGGYRSSVPYENSGGNTPAEPKVTVTETPYSVVVGGGGAGGTAACAGGSNGPGSDGGASSALGITAAGGGGGGGNSVGRAGGSSGGSGNTATSPDPIIPAAPPVATAQGYKGGINQGGGGGAGSPGGDGLSGSGGSGLASSITGAWITRGVGGTNSAGIVNSGGGGGRGNYCTGGSAGGSGIVIIRYRTNGFDGISPLSTGGTKTTSGIYTIHTFTSDGIFVPVKQ
jgi:prepilin-type N-terminal cleavage/methylation domain-containing protein